MAPLRAVVPLLVTAGMLLSHQANADACEPGETCERPSSPMVAHVMAVKLATRVAAPADLEPRSAEREALELFRQAVLEQAETRAKRDPDQPTMPWIWREIRRTAVQHLPRKNIDRFRATFAPCIVSSGFDTVAGAGVSGSF